jgi:carbohydrate kinase (thermoresistant glucokinase family)
VRNAAALDPAAVGEAVAVLAADHWRLRRSSGRFVFVVSLLRGLLVDAYYGMTIEPRIVVMGVSGSGKSTLGQALAAALGVEFVEGDALHPPRNVELMAAGIALTDADRAGWIGALAARLKQACDERRGMVMACSALKRAYRDRLRDEGAPDLVLVHLHGDAKLLAERMAARRGHYMPPSLLQSQLDTLEPPASDERAVPIDIAWPTERQLGAALAGLRAIE